MGNYDPKFTPQVYTPLEVEYVRKGIEEVVGGDRRPGWHCTPCRS